ncbi:MAG: hypothetical protein AB2L09_08360 [Coriobacteriia bacterium]
MQRIARTFLVIVSVLNGVSGLLCGALLIAQPSGSLMQMGALLPSVQRMPLADVFFRDFRWTGIAMLVALAAPNLTASVLLLRRHRKQYVAALVAAIFLAAWCSFELVYIFNAPAVGYLVIAIVSIAASLMLMRRASAPDV